MSSRGNSTTEEDIGGFEEYHQEVSELTDIEYGVLSYTFASERRDVAVDVIKTVVAEELGATPEVWTERLRELAKVERLGEHRPGYWEGYELTYEYNDYLRIIGRWPRPGRLALLTPTTQIREVAPLPLEEGIQRNCLTHYY